MKIKLTSICVLLLVVMWATAKPQNSGSNSLSKQELNKKLIIDLYQKLFSYHDVEGVDEYIIPGERAYIQHNPWVEDGRPALKRSARSWFEEGPWTSEILRSVAVDDYVWLHVRASSPVLKNVLGGNGTVAIVEIFRLDQGMVVEHWDVIQAVPEQAANSHPMF